MLEVYLTFACHKNPCQSQNNSYYIKKIGQHVLQNGLVKNGESQGPIGGSKVWVQTGWQSYIPIKAKVFISRLMVGGTSSTQLFCEDKVSLLECVNCPMARVIWTFISIVWTSISRVSKENDGEYMFLESRVSKSRFKWVFGHAQSRIRSPYFEIAFHCIRYWKL